MSPARRRVCIDRVIAKFGVSERLACRVLGQHRSTQRRVATSRDDEAETNIEIGPSFPSASQSCLKLTFNWTTFWGHINTTGDAINVILSAVGYIFRRLLVWLRFIFAILLIAINQTKRKENQLSLA